MMHDNAAQSQPGCLAVSSHLHNELCGYRIGESHYDPHFTMIEAHESMSRRHFAA